MARACALHLDKSKEPKTRGARSGSTSKKGKIMFQEKLLSIVRSFVTRDPKTWSWEMCVTDVFNANGAKVSQAAHASACSLLRAEFKNRTFSAIVWNEDNVAKALRLIGMGAEANGEPVNFRAAVASTEKAK